LLAQIQLDLGTVISATRQPLYPKEAWDESYNNQLPELSPIRCSSNTPPTPKRAFHFRLGQVAPLQAAEMARTPIQTWLLLPSG
jgi:hypothetical protein